jgi:hypothetical protein
MATVEGDLPLGIDVAEKCTAAELHPNTPNRAITRGAVREGPIK